MDNRPRGREKNVTGPGKDIKKRGEGLGTGPVGRPEGYAGRQEQSASAETGHTRASSGGGSLIKIVLAAILLLGGGSFGLSNLLGGGGDTATVPSSYIESTPAPSQGMSGSISNPSSTPSSSSGSSSSSGAGLSGMLQSSVGNVSTGWTEPTNASTLDAQVDTTARAKRTNILCKA